MSWFLCSFTHIPLGNLETLFGVLFRVGILLPLLSSLLVQREEGITTWWKSINDYRWRGWIWPRCFYDYQQFWNIVQTISWVIQCKPMCYGLNQECDSNIQKKSILEGITLHKFHFEVIDETIWIPFLKLYNYIKKGKLPSKSFGSRLNFFFLV